ncbi:hypothetical protein A3D78_04235 [Candidatus Gottesmanbacteria bacterium RIFCSPHIGHO2_02_FULL_39_14]|uniref:Uncharacterized protein n=2 Tax=Candidatus Gottesmaniibacteriota TaxID=1752720 RepID=A0A1F6A0G1_9BACT|nr:MAG: hypothetical protein A3D78_04235 [Candidatus Gottesmanbacteria bacterium RIFCSPHIGHO2_02_FULL_39_14]OGG32391.1 MAG: hypothetical protein A3I51_04535 [Candidatus Gottesmanbacteria bacterium RIFCSPLOWO2_02_FULL_38_8]
MLDKKTMGLFIGLIGLAVFLYILSKTTNLKQFFNFGNFTASPSASTNSSSTQGRSTFFDLLPTPTP